MMINIGINGYGRIGRLLIRQLSEHPDYNVKAINTRSEVDENLLKYDSVFGTYRKKEIKKEKDILYIGDQEIKLSRNSDINNTVWDESIDVVVDCTGKFKTHDDLSKHLQNNVQKVILSCPPKDETVPMYLIGVNEKDYAGEKVVSCASCSTNGIAPIIKVLNDGYDIKAAHIVTVHAVTTSDNILDGSHKKQARRGRSAMVSIRDTSTGAAGAMTDLFPGLDRKVFVNAYRVPVPDGSLLDFTVEFNHSINIETLKERFEDYEKNEMKGVLETTVDPIVSCDCIKNSHSTIVDLDSIRETAPNTIKFAAFYDNEWGYTSRLVDLIGVVCKDIKK